MFKSYYLTLLFIGIVLGLNAQNPTGYTAEKADNTSATFNLKNSTGFWHLSGPRSYEMNNTFSIFWNDGTYKRYFNILDNGKVGIGTSSPDAELTVKGNIHAEEVKVDLSVPGPDYVFKEGYNLRSLEEVQNYIQQHGHLPNIPSAKEMESNGIDLGLMNMKLLEKIEELMLYTMKQQKELMVKEQKLKNLLNDLGKVKLNIREQEVRMKKLEQIINLKQK